MNTESSSATFSPRLPLSPHGRRARAPLAWFQPALWLLGMCWATPAVWAAPLAQQAYLKASNTGPDDYFGHAVAVSGDTVVVGAPWEDSMATGMNGNQSDNSGFNAGAAYVFVRSGGSWVQQAYLKASNTGAPDNFGVSVAIDGDTIVIGASQEASSASGVNGDQSNNSAFAAGAAYVFVRSGTNWSQQAYLKASNPGGEIAGVTGGDLFGSVAVSGNTVVVGAYRESSSATGVNGNQVDNSAIYSGAAYVFVRSGTTWSQQAYLKASDTQPNAYFGTSVAASGDSVVVGANGANAAYVFFRNGSIWTQQARLTSTNDGGSGNFGSWLSISGNTVGVGGNAMHGATIFVRNGAIWSQQAYLDLGDNTLWAGLVAVSGDRAVVADSFQLGTVFVFSRSGTIWTQQAVFDGFNRGVRQGLNAVALSGDRVVAGAAYDISAVTGVNGDQCDTNSAYSGAAYIFDSTAVVVPSPPDIAVGPLTGASFTNGSGADFGNVPADPNSDSQRTFVIRNLGDAALTGLGITLTGPNAAEFTVIAGPDSPVAKCATTLFTVRFAPGAVGNRSAVLHISSNDSDESPFDILLTGTSIPPVPEISVDQPAGSVLTDGASGVDFGIQQTGLGTQRSFVIRSLGNVNLAGVGATITGPHGGDFAVTTPPDSPVVPGSNTSFTVTFTPAAVGARTATLHIASNDSDESPFDIMLTGRGVPPLQAAAQSYLKASSPGAGDLFGYSVAVSGDTMVVGSRYESSHATGVNGNQNDNSATNAGAAYVFVRDGSTWVQQAYLKASNTGSNDQFGFRVAIAGDTIVVGAPLEDSNATGVNGNQNDNSAVDAGAAYVFVRNGSTWVQQAYLKASNTGGNDAFGWWVALSGDTVVVGALGESSNATGVNGSQTNNSAGNSGAAYVFVRDGSTWTQQAYLKASNPGALDFFGESVAIDGNTLVVGAGSEDSNATGVNGSQTNNSAGNSGAAYVFVRNGTTWTQQAYLKASNPGSLGSDFTGDIFGVVVAISGNTIVVGAPREDSNATGVNGNQGDESFINAGAAYVFVRNGATWSQQAYLKASHPDVQDLFGLSVSVSGDLVLVGAPYEDSNATGLNGNAQDNSASAAGAAYTFARERTNWIQRAYFKASNTESSDYFAGAVSISGDTLVIGASDEDSSAAGANGNPLDNGATSSGAAYVFDLVPPPTIVTHPANQIVFTGSNAVFSVVATSANPPLAYRWLFNGAELPGATNDSLTISNTQIAHLGTYQAVVSDTARSANSAVATLDLIDALFITSQPVGLTVRAGSNVTYSVSAYGTAPLHYRWQLNGMDLANETNSILLVPNVQSANLGGYTVVITNPYAAVTSAVATLALLTPPIITQPPVPVVAIAGENVTFTVTVTNTATLPINYQWRKGSIPLTNILLHSTTCSFTLYNVQTNVTSTNGPGSYRVVITNAAVIPGPLPPNSQFTLMVLTASPPAVLTGPASHVTGSSASLQGSINPLGSTTTFRFEYGLTTSYGSSTPAMATNGTSLLSVSSGVTGLLPGSNYHYRIIASNHGGVATGLDQTFTTVGQGPQLVLTPDGTGGYFLRFTGIPGLSYRSQRAPGVAGPWDTIDTQAAPASGLIEVHDITPPPGQAFYRVVQP